MIDTVRPVLKKYDRQVGSGKVVIDEDIGIRMILPDLTGQVSALLDLLNGSRTIQQVADDMIVRFPGITIEDVIGAITALDEAGLLEDVSADSSLTRRQQERYLSNLSFFGTFASLAKSRYSFQEALCNSHVLLLGVGGLGSTLLYNLAGLGVGQITVVDYDRVELKNLTRQFLYSEAHIGQSKLPHAVARAQALNSELRITAVERLIASPDDIAELVGGCDLILCAIDHPLGVQGWVNQAAVEAGVPFIAGGANARRGLYYSVDPGRSGCLECNRLHAIREAGDSARHTTPDIINRVVGPVAILMAALISMEVARYLTGFAAPISDARMWLVDLATSHADVAYEWPQLSDCSLCGQYMPTTGGIEPSVGNQPL